MLLVGLAVVHTVQQRRSAGLLLETPVAMPKEPSSSPHTRSDDARVRFSEAFVLPRDGALHVELERSPMVGWVGVACALIDLDRGTVREFALDSDELPASAAGQSSRPHAIRIGSLAAGSYRLRIDPGWQPLEQPRPARAINPAAWPAAPRAVVRVSRGFSLSWGLLLAALLIATPPLVGLWRWRQKGREAATSPEAAR